FFGIDSGVRHAVTGADYGTVRTAAFMGYRMIAAAAGLKVSSEEAPLRVEDPRWGGYLANLRPGEFADSYEGALPVEMEGAEFLARFGGITDPVTRVEPGHRYPIRQATAHPIHEQARVTRFAELLGIPGLSDGTAVELGRLMYASHRSYGSCGLGHPGTDRLVELVAELGTGRGLFGAKITGGGSGGTVAVLARDGARAEIEALAQRYREETGQGGEVFADSGPGAAETGVLELALRR
ncbi:MAG TPA: hypothetical protein VLD58_08380, partial [Gemmatimonadales bacterium]|nr:hypothetical protein [Gemmatimonadales bacterium]